jgi:mRNA interferase HicA
MKRSNLLRHLEKQGCEFLREGGNHTIYVNRRAQKSSAIPRHREIIDFPRTKDLQRPRYSRAVTFFLSLVTGHLSLFLHVRPAFSCHTEA